MGSNEVSGVKEGYFNVSECPQTSSLSIMIQAQSKNILFEF